MMPVEVSMRSLTALLLTGVVGVLLVAWQWSRLPERVASHFNAAGTADGWMPRNTHLLLAAGLFIGMTALFALIGASMRRLPARWISLPNRDHWLSGDREAQTRRELAAWCYGFGALLNLFLAVVFQLVYLANLSEPPALDSTVMLACLVAYVGLSLAGVIFMISRYSRPD
jgi:uncharacterized membrane protein